MAQRKSGEQNVHNGSFTVQIVVTQTQVGKSRPRYTLDEMPVWEEAPLEQEASGASA